MYQLWKGSNIFFLGGRFVFGPDVRSVFLSIFLIVAPVLIFCIFVARKLFDEFDHHLGILIMVIAIVYTIYVISGKQVEKDVKVLKAKISDDGVLDNSLEAILYKQQDRGGSSTILSSWTS